MRAIGYVQQGDFLRVDEKQMKDEREEHPQRLRAIEKRLTDTLNKVKKEFALLPPRIELDHMFTSVSGAACASEMGKRHTMEVKHLPLSAFSSCLVLLCRMMR